MSFNDPIADFLTRLRNGGMALHRYVDVNWSKMAQRLAEILKEEGYIEHFMVKREGPQGTIRMFPRYHGRRPVIQGLKRLSTPGCRKYVGANNIKPVMRGMGISILSTSKGVMVGEKARQEKVGGELICRIW